MSNASNKVPAYTRQREKGRTDRAVVRVNGKRHVLGAYGSEESRRKYRELVFGTAAEDEPAEVQPVAESTEPTCSELIVRYLEHAADYYRAADGTLSSEYPRSVNALAYVRRQCGGMRADEFGPKLLKRVRQTLVDEGLARRYVNDQCRRIVRAWRWAVGEEIIPPSVYQALEAVEGLRKGRTQAKDSTERGPVDEATVEATIAKLPEVVADMVQVQRFTGMRSGELVQMRPCDIDRSGPVWFYTPRRHKSQHKGKSRVVAIGPKCQTVLLKYLARANDMHLFRPCDSEAKRRAEQHAKRETPIGQGNRPGSNRVPSPKRKAGEAYTPNSYRKAIQRAAEAAKVAKWFPHQLRHAAATNMQREFGIEAAQVALGHSSAAVTAIYAERDLKKAAEVARKIG